MPSVGLSEAAKLTGRNQSTIHRAMKVGRLAYTVEASGERRIDVSELDRVFGVKTDASADAMAQPVQSNAAQAGELAALQRLLDDREATIRDLRARLDASEAERRAAQAMLTDQRADRSAGPTGPPLEPVQPRRWWRWRRV
jgi:hypothetical protein